MNEFHYRFLTPTMIRSENIIQKKHWAERFNYRRMLGEEIYYLTLEAKRNFDAIRDAGFPIDWRTRVIYTSFRRSFLDDDNLVAGTKPWTDALVACGWARGDSPNIFKAKFEQIIVKRKSDEMTGIDITIY